MPLNMNESVDVTFTCAITHQKHLAQSGRSTRSAVDIFNTLRVFTKKPIRQQEIKLVCMNKEQSSTCGMNFKWINASNFHHEISTACIVDSTTLLHRGCVEFKLSCLIS